MYTFEKLTVWNKAHELAISIYKATLTFPRDEMYGLTSQLRRASVSVPTNIVEGRARGSTNDFLRFLKIARGSLEETEYLLILSRDLKYLAPEEYEKLKLITKEVSATLNGLISSLKG
jgi:four helix bundle protein